LQFSIILHHSAAAGGNCHYRLPHCSATGSDFAIFSILKPDAANRNKKEEENGCKLKNGKMIKGIIKGNDNYLNDIKAFRMAFLNIKWYPGEHCTRKMRYF
jgi:hypothetical protein